MSSPTTSSTSVRRRTDPAADRVAAVQAAAVLDAWLHGERAFWERRAQQLEAARPRSGDFHGRATRDELRDRWERLSGAALACRRRALFTDAGRADLARTLADLGGRYAA